MDPRVVLERGCVGKTRMSRASARLVAERMRATGRRVSPYRCPCCHSWHVGHVPSIEGVETIARAIRGLDVESGPRSGSSVDASHPLPREDEPMER